MPDPVLVEGPAALDTIIHTFAPKLAETWPGDETLVGMLAQEGERVGIVWAPRERLLADLSKRADVERDPKRRSRYDAAMTALNAPPANGKVIVIVAGWGDLLTIEVEADDLRTGKTFTTWRGGTA
jgi:hypothetical protein